MQESLEASLVRIHTVGGLVLDRAGWHTSTALTVPEGLHLLFLPPYSHEFSRPSHLWPLFNEPLVNRHVHDLDELEDVQAERSCVLTGFS